MDSIVLNRHLLLDDTQTELLYKVFSGLLPHENYEPSCANSLQRKLFATLPTEEVYGVNYLFYRMFINLDIIMLSFGKTAGLTRESFDASLQFSIRDVLQRPEFDAPRLFREYGKDYDLAEPSAADEAVDFIYSLALEVYDEVCAMAIPTGEAISYIVPLRDSLRRAVVERSLRLEGLALDNQVIVNGKAYSGTEGVLELRKVNEADMLRRFADDSTMSRSAELWADSYESVKIFNRDNATMIRPLAMFGYEPVDQLFPMRTQDIICLVADEGVGKTKLAVDWIHTLLMNGQNVLVICGETEVAKFYKMIQLNHIAATADISLTLDEFNNRDKLPHDTEEDLEALNIRIEAACDDLAGNPKYGKALLRQNVSYESFYSYAKSKAVQYDISAVVVDHVGILNSDGSRTVDGFLDNEKKRIDWLFRQEDALTKELNLCFINTVHLQNESSDKLSSGKKLGIRIGSGSRSTTKFASLAMLLYTTEELERQSIYLLEFKKVRDYKKPPTLALFRDGATCRHTYYPKLQRFVAGESEDISATRIDDVIGADVSEDEDEYGIDLGLEV